MSSISAFIRTVSSDKKKPVKIRFRLRDGRNFQLFHKSEISVIPSKWDERLQKVKARSIIDETERNNIDNAINDRKKLIGSIYIEKGKELTSSLLDEEIDKILNPKKYKKQHQTFFEAFDEFLIKHELSEVRKSNYRVVLRSLGRFEEYIRKTEDNDFTLMLDSISPETIQEYSDYLKKEHIYHEKMPELYENSPLYHKKQKRRGQNTVNNILTKVRTFLLWCVKNKKTNNKPFDDYKINESVYGTPYYITIEERNQLYKLDLSDRPELEKQRDIFVFQCVIGCRINDLYSFKKENVINGGIEYIARKSKDKKPVTVRVPLNSIASEIINKYVNFDSKILLPFIARQDYNYAIKEVFTLAGITRSVVTLDTITRESVIRPINEVASSHLARRCFVGNMYKKVKDQNLVAELSGHTQGSKAFARYREIDEEMRKELVSMIE